MSQLEPNVLKYVWKNSRPDQLWMLVIILASMPTYFLSLELPKRIVNGPIQGQGFENPDDTARFLTTYLPLPDWMIGGEPILLFPGFELDRLSLLYALSVTFLLLVAANGLFKLYINTFKGRMGERIMRRLRYQLFDRVLRYPLSRFRRTKASEIASMIKDEVEPMGNFIGDAFTQPLFLGGQALTGLTFIFLQNIYLGIVTLVVVAFQAWLVPRLRRRLLVLGKMRQIEARQMAGHIGEVVEGIQEVHVNDTTNRERSILSATLGRLFFIRFELYQRKFSVKFINNMLIQFLAFIFYAAGGYLAISGRLDIGQLVAVIAAYKDLPDPIRGLIDYDQQRLTVEVRYQQITEQFAADDLIEADMQAIPQSEVEPLSKGYEFANLHVIDDTGSKLIEKATAEIELGEQVAVIGAVNSGASHFTEVAASILRPTSGKVELDGQPIYELPEYVTGRRLAYIDSSSYFPQQTVLEALTYVLKNQPVGEIELDDEQRRDFEKAQFEAKRSGNSMLNADTNWIDLERIGASNAAELKQKIHAILVDTDLEADIRSLGLRGTLDPEKHPDMAEHLIEARRRFRDKLDDLGFSGIVEPFDPDRYNDQATIGENILFGTAILPAYQASNLPANPLARAVLDKSEIHQSLFEMGKEVAATTVELFGDLSEDNPFFDQLTYMEPDQIPEYRAILNRIGDKPIDEVSRADQEMILRLPFAYTESRNRLGLLTDELKEGILRARKNMKEALEGLSTNPVNFYDPESYNPAASVLDNVLLGRISTSVAGAQEQVTDAIRNLLEEMELTDDIFRIGLDFNMGTGGKRLSETQRQKLHLARALLKKPDFLIVNQGLNTLDARTQKQLLDMVLAKAKGADGHNFGVIWTPTNTAFAKSFDRILVFKQGTLVADGSPTQLESDSPEYGEIVTS